MWPFLNNITTTCEQNYCTPASSICYTGSNLSCIGVNQNDTLSVALQKINAVMCEPIPSAKIIEALGYTPANDANVLHTTGDETKNGSLTVNDTGNGVGVKGISVNGSGLYGESENAPAGYFISNNAPAIYAFSQNGQGIVSLSNTGTGVQGISETNFGIYGQSNSNTGLSGNSVSGLAGVFNTGSGTKIVSFVANFIEQAYILATGLFKANKILVNTVVDNGIDALQVEGSVNVLQYKISALNTAPATSTSNGTLGEIRITATHIYVCTATNTWVRTALTTWV